MGLRLALAAGKGDAARNGARQATGAGASHERTAHPADWLHSFQLPKHFKGFPEGISPGNNCGFRFSSDSEVITEPHAFFQPFSEFVFRRFTHGSM
jgi:hypothetical protein